MVIQFPQHEPEVAARVRPQKTFWQEVRPMILGLVGIAALGLMFGVFAVFIVLPFKLLGLAWAAMFG